MFIMDFDYDLFVELIVQQFFDKREGSRMLVFDCSAGGFTDLWFIDLLRFLRFGDMFVLNNTKVFSVRLLGVSEIGVRVEVFLVREIDERIWETLTHPARQLQKRKHLT